MSPCHAVLLLLSSVRAQNVLYAWEFSETVLDPMDSLEPYVQAVVDGRSGKLPQWSASCDAGNMSWTFCREELGLTGRVLGECAIRVWQQMAEKEMLIALESSSIHSDRLTRAGIERTNIWWETTASWFPSFLASHHDLLFTRPIRILEIGSYEGGSTIWFQRFLLTNADSRLLSIDSWADERDARAYSPTGDLGAQPSAQIKGRFVRNVKAVANAHKVTAVQADSAVALATLLAASRDQPGFDFVYVDGSHRASQILIDVSLSWRLLNDQGGLMLLDDYKFAHHTSNHEDPDQQHTEDGRQLSCGATIRHQREANATIAIDTVLAAVPDGAEILHCGYQLLVRKNVHPPAEGESDQAEHSSTTEMLLDGDVAAAFPELLRKFRRTSTSQLPDALRPTAGSFL